MSFLWTDMLWLLVLVPALAAVYIFILRRRQKYALRFASLSIMKDAVGRGPGFRRHIPPILFLLGITVMLLAIARPVTTVILPSQQGTVILAIDVSGSMRAEDVKPSRLEAAKSAARTFIEKQSSHVRIGIVSFSGSTAVVQPPTTNHELLSAAINRLVSQRSTAIGSGILMSLATIFEEPGGSISTTPDPITLAKPKNAPPPVARGSYSQGIIVLLSDGQSNTGPSPLDAADRAADRGVRVYTIGLGSPGGTILNFEGWTMRVRLDEDTLKKVAEKTDGKYFRADSETDLQKIYENLGTQIVFAPEQTEITALFTALAGIFLLAGILLSLLWFSRIM
jgi:Ca-activated chloride channel homolog